MALVVAFVLEKRGIGAVSRVFVPVCVSVCLVTAGRRYGLYRLSVDDDDDDYDGVFATWSPNVDLCWTVLRNLTAR